MITNAQIELLADIQRLAIAGPGQTGHVINHSYSIHADGLVTSSVQVMSLDFESSEHLTSASNRASALYDSVTLGQQRDELASWIAANRKEKAA